MGNVRAKTELVALNPYAAMCNQMLAEVLEKAKQGGAPATQSADTAGKETQAER